MIKIKIGTPKKKSTKSKPIIDPNTVQEVEIEPIKVIGCIALHYTYLHNDPGQVDRYSITHIPTQRELGDSLPSGVPIELIEPCMIGLDTVLKDLVSLDDIPILSTANKKIIIDNLATLAELTHYCPPKSDYYCPRCSERVTSAHQLRKDQPYLCKNCDHSMMYGALLPGRFNLIALEDMLNSSAFTFACREGETTMLPSAIKNLIINYVTSNMKDFINGD